MASVRVTTTDGRTVTINSEEVARILEQSSYREIWLGPGNIASTGTTVLSVKNTMSTLLSSFGLASVTDFNTNRTFAVNSAFVSRVIDETGSYRTIWFGPGSIPGVASSMLSVKETATVLQTRLSFPKVTDYNNSRINLMNPLYVSRVVNSGAWREIWTGTGNVEGVAASRTAVRETVAQLKQLGIG